MTNNTTHVGIDDMALYVPTLYLELSELAEARGIPYEKLKHGLDLERMAVPDSNEDAATMMAEAVLELIERNSLIPNTIGRIYLGTESAVDGAKPTATYAVGMVESALSEQYGARSLRRCDVVDLTFACIGATDALQNCLDWVRGDANRQAIVVASDIAKYELGSTGEYTQGAGAVAMLVKHNPRLMSIEDRFGVGMESVHDFFKPRRNFAKSSLVKSVLAEAGILNGQAEGVMNRLSESQNTPFAMPDREVSLFREMPVFDGPFSNICYTNRAIEAIEHFSELVDNQQNTPIFDRWRRMIFHLPYAAHARRIGVDIYLSEMKRLGKIDALEQTANTTSPSEKDFTDAKAFAKAQNTYLKAISETPDYQEFIKEKLETSAKASSQVGNVYTASIFLALMSALELELTDNQDITNQKYGFVAYGSGSKAKAFEGVLQANWREVVEQFGVFSKLSNRQQISFAEYKNLHTGHTLNALNNDPKASFKLMEIGGEGQLEGARRYAL
jgi:hydroxymethylglutaryl-CoA synthase